MPYMPTMDRNQMMMCSLNSLVELDFWMISEFWKNNIDCMKKMFLEFNSRLAKVLGQGFEFVDGSKFQA